GTKSAEVLPASGRPAPAKIALVLGAGAARGFAHIGVIKILEENHIPINMVVGTSAGSVVGSLYAAGYNGFQLQKIALDVNKSDIVDLCFPDDGFIKGDKLEEFVNRMVKNVPLEKLKIPFYPVATDIRTGKEVVFATGNTGAAVRASCSIPGVFRPASFGGRTFVDGGVVSPVAVSAARARGADLIIAVDISSDLDHSTPQGTVDTILQSVNIMYSKISSIQLPGADVVIRPKVGKIGSSDFGRRSEAIMEGERAAIEALPRIKAALAKLRAAGRL
ncbi:MAG: patatin-like phospholipase family protein, partial [Nitrospirota bacterium]